MRARRSPRVPPAHGSRTELPVGVQVAHAPAVDLERHRICRHSGGIIDVRGLGTITLAAMDAETAKSSSPPRSRIERALASLGYVDDREADE